ncbi:hypothetical protein ACFU99_15755 [Streptomyces sp. NPDC057654]|uniref:hypothetical protein n=1 Tax=Streptomyces sp. NPDC057654 TaxID=3346196 RepID=UPI0036C39E4E
MDDPFRFSAPLRICDQLLSRSVELMSEGDLRAITVEGPPSRPDAEREAKLPGALPGVLPGAGERTGTG